jgi:hypothetical protein
MHKFDHPSYDPTPTPEMEPEEISGLITTSPEGVKMIWGMCSNNGQNRMQASQQGPYQIWVRTNNKKKISSMVASIEKHLNHDAGFKMAMRSWSEW